MNSQKMNRAVAVLAVWLALWCGVSPVLAGEDREPLQPAGATANPAQEEPKLYYETEGDFFLGYRLVSTDDSLKAAEYLYPHSSLTFGLNLLSGPLPYRYHVNAEFVSNYDFYTDAGFAYKDLVLFRDILVGVHHNLPHFDYQFAGEPPDLTYSDRNPGDLYYLDFISNLMSLRLKTPDFPLHTFLSHRHVERDGRIQQRFLLGDFDHTNKVSESRDIDWKSDAVKLGVNSHLGPVELEYAYDQAEFNPGRNNILQDSFPAPDNLSRPADIYPHHVVPETESSANSIKLHSSYTGGLVAAATLSSLHQKNNYSLTRSATWKGAFDLSWIPDPVVGLFFKYRHREVDLDTPDRVTLTGLNSALNYSVREGISYDKDLFSLSTRYRALSKLSLFGTYEFSHLNRREVAEWDVLPGQTSIHRLDFTAHARPLPKLKVKASYEYKNYNQPAYNSTPDVSNKLRLKTTYTPAPWLNLYLEYILAVTSRDSLRYLNSSPVVLVETGERDGQRDQLLASLSTELTTKLSLTASWFYQRWEIEQDLAYGKRLDLPYLDVGVPYTDESNSFSLSLQYLPRKDLTVSTDLTHTITEGTTGHNDLVGGAPYSLASFSTLKASETSFSLDVAKKLSREWELGLKSYLGIYNDRVSGLLDGKVFTTTFSLKRYF
jgi:hypothetical protein